MLIKNMHIELRFYKIRLTCECVTEIQVNRVTNFQRPKSLDFEI